MRVPKGLSGRYWFRFAPPPKHQMLRTEGTEDEGRSARDDGKRALRVRTVDVKRSVYLGGVRGGGRAQHRRGNTPGGSISIHSAPFRIHRRAPGYFFEALEASRSALEDDFERASLRERRKVDICNTLHAKTRLLRSPGGIKTDQIRIFVRSRAPKCHPWKRKRGVRVPQKSPPTPSSLAVLCGSGSHPRKRRFCCVAPRPPRTRKTLRGSRKKRFCGCDPLPHN